MRSTLIILIIAVMVLSGCKPKSKSSLEIKTNDSAKSNKGLTIPDIEDMKNNNNTASANSNWSKEFRNKFLEGCIGKASEKVNASDAFSYCNCMTDKVEAKYPNENEVDSKLSDADIESMKQGCVTLNSAQSNPSYDQSNSSNNPNTQSWSGTDQREFMDNCTPGASKSMDTKGANDYCECMMKKLMKEYPDSKDVVKISENRMSVLANDCLRK